jgi:hypothetical protein
LSETEIPEAALDAMYAGMHLHPAERARALGTGLEDAAPHIARAAQATVLDHMADVLRDSHETTKILAYFDSAEQCRRMANQLKRGAGPVVAGVESDG